MRLLIILPVLVLVGTPSSATCPAPEPGEAFASARFTPLFEGGSFSGIRVERVKDTDFISCVGFENGDLLIEYNGKRPTSLDAAQETIQAVRTEAPTSVTVVRGGESVQLLPRSSAV